MAEIKDKDRGSVQFIKKKQEGSIKVKNNPKLGLAMGGIGVEGLAHAGVLHVFEKEGFAIDAIAASSVGAVVAAIYALNRDFDKDVFLEKITNLGIPFTGSFSDKTNGFGSHLSKLKHLIQAGNFFAEAALGWGILPDYQVAKFIGKVTLCRNLEDGKVRLAVVATDVVSGNKIVFKEGLASLAVQASAAMPGFVPPLLFEELLLIDGTLVDPVPCEVVRQMGTDYVIAVDVDHGDCKTEVRSGLDVFFRANEICTRSQKSIQLKTANFVIRPDFGESIHPLDISKAKLCIEAGAIAARNALPQLRNLLVD